jgi:hypothetical protein
MLGIENEYDDDDYVVRKLEPPCSLPALSAMILEAMSCSGGPNRRFI